MILGFSEIIFIAFVAFIFLGPDKTGIYFKKVLSFWRNINADINVLKNDITKEATEPFNEIKEMIQKEIQDQVNLLNPSESLGPLHEVKHTMEKEFEDHVNALNALAESTSIEKEDIDCVIEE